MNAAEWNPNSAQHTGPTAIGRPRIRWEDYINDFFTIVEDEQKTLLKAAAKSTERGSTQQETAEDGHRSKKNTQRPQKNDMKLMRE